VFKRNLRLVASDQYWNKEAVQSRIIDEPVVEDSLAALRAYRSGQVDWLSWVEESLIGQMKDKGGYDDLHTFKGFGTYFYSLNCLPKLSDGRNNPLADVRVRRALALAIDKTLIVQNATKAGEVVANDYIPPGVFSGYVSPDGLGFDPAKARQLLAEAGYPNGEGFPSLQIIFNKEVIQHADIALLMRNMWQKNLGITMDIQQLEIKVFAARYHARDFAIARGSWIGDYPDPTTFTDKYKSGNDDNEPGWSNAQYDALCAAAEKQTDPNERMKTLARAEGILLQDAPIIPLYHYVDAYMMRSDVVGVPLDPRDMVMLSAVRKIR
jgi:oligopeptide transport system substrate-binding protein